MTPRKNQLARATLVAVGLVAFLAFGSPVARAQQGDDIDQRLDRLGENSLRELTGAIEQLQFRNQQLEQQLTRLQGEGGAARSPAAPPPIAAGPPPAPRTAPAGVAPAPVGPGGRRSDVFDPAANPNAPGAPRVLGSNEPLRQEGAVGAPGGREPGAPLDLGAVGAPGGGLPPPPQRNPSATGELATLPPSNSPRDELALGYGYLQRKDYASAELTLREFIKKYPSDPLASEAHFWLGESLFQRQRFRDAAEIFLGVTRNFEKSAKAPDALLRLGQSLAALNEKEAACAALGAVNQKYQKASAEIKKSVDAEQKKNRC